MEIEGAASVRAQVGVHSRRVRDMTQRTEDLKLQAEKFLSDLRDTDFTEAISRFTQLQQQLQANLQVSALVMRMSLLDFLG